MRTPCRLWCALIAMVFSAVASGMFIGSTAASASTVSATASFNPNLLMSDAVFDATGTMSTSAIQAFLNRFPNSCLRTYQAVVPLDYSNYGGKVSAAQVISTSATMYGVNPQVILATLEKEQSLVTGGAGCASWRYWSAMGYACPDGGASYSYPSLGITNTCVSKQQHAGFSAQVNHGTWQLQFNRQRAIGNLYWRDNETVPNYGFYTKGTYQDYAGAPLIKHDGVETIDGQAVTMTNGVTATLYTYTPHIAGNQSFVNLFTNWFGSTTGTPVVEPPVVLDPVATGAYVDNVYRLFLGRPANDGEETWWYNYLQSGHPYSAFVNWVTGSKEARDRLVVNDYVVVLNRAADEGGVNTWSSLLARTGRNDTILATLAGSNEYFRVRGQSDITSFVTFLYQDLLGRNVDKGGLSTWTGQLQAGTMTRAQVAFAILQSQEYARNVVRQAYLSVLGRDADPGGLSYWMGVYSSRHNVAMISGALAAGSEGVAYLSTLQ